MNLPQYNPALATAPLTDEEQDELETSLDQLGLDAAMNLEALDGYCCALLLAAALPAAEAWLPPVWGFDAPPPEGSSAPFASGKQLKRCAQSVLRHLADVDRRLKADAEGYEPLFGIAQLDDEDATFVADAEAWCIGFLQGASLQPAFWDPLFEDATCGQALAPITLFAADPAELTDDERAMLDDIGQRDALSHQVQASIGTLYRALRAVPQA
ncbi:MAG: UPF0149 family protein [Burkholderiales bacterium]